MSSRCDEEDRGRKAERRHRGAVPDDRVRVGWVRLFAGRNSLLMEYVYLTDRK